MKQFLRKAFVLAVAAVGMAGSGWAQEWTEVTSTYLTNPTLDGLDGWTSVHSNDSKGYTAIKNGKVVEYYSQWGSGTINMTFSLSQEITLPAGTYMLTSNSFYREGEGTSIISTKAHLFAGEKKVSLSGLRDASMTLDAAAETLPNADASSPYYKEVKFTVSEEGTINVGLAGAFNTMRSWCVTSGFKLYKAEADYIFGDNESVAGWTKTSENADLVVNTHSTEGETSGIEVPFIQNWTWRANNLSDGTTTYTVSGLPAGYYSLSANVRIFSELGNTPAEGMITLDLNGEGSVDAVSGKEVKTYGDNMKFISETYTVKGIVTNSGELKFNANFTSTNFNWVAYKDIVIKRLDGELPAGYTALQAAVEKYQPLSFSTTAFAYYEEAKAGLEGFTFTDAEAQAKADGFVNAYRAYLRSVDAECYNANAFGNNIDITTDVGEYSDVTGWTNISPTYNYGTKKVNNADSGGEKNMIENYRSQTYGGGTLNGSMYTTVSNLPSGKYFVRAQVATDPLQEDDYLYITSGENTATAPVYSKAESSNGYPGNGTKIQMTEAIKVTNGTVELGLRVTDVNWANIAVVKLKVLEIDPETRSIATGKYGSICLPYNATVEGAKLMAVTGLDGSTLTLEEVTGDLVAGKPYLYEATADAQTFTWKADADLTATAMDDNYLVGLLKPTEVSEGFILQTNPTTNKQAFYTVGSAITVPAYRSYMKPNDNGVRVFNFADNTTTGVAETLEALSSGKADIYDMNGRKIEKLQKGVNIVNGKKVIVK